MVPTKQTVTTWTANWFTDPAFQSASSERTAFLATMIATDKTPSTESLGDTSIASADPTKISFRRPWLDQAAAQEWVDFLTALSAKYSLPFVSSVVSDYQAPV